MQTINLLEDNVREMVDDPGFGDDFLNMIPKAWSMKELISWISLYLKCLLQERHCRENEKKTHSLEENICRRYICYSKDCCSKYTKNSKNSIVKKKKKMTQFKNGPNRHLTK